MDSKWVEHLINEYSSGLLRYIRQHTANTEDAEDILQDVYMSVYEHCAEFDPEKCNEQAWLFIIAKRKLIDYYRRKKDNQSLDAMEEWEVPGVDSMSQATNIISARQTVANALAKLDERSRKIVVYKYFNGLSGDEIAKKMGLSVQNVRTILSRALDSMEDTIGAFEFDG